MNYIQHPSNNHVFGAPAGWNQQQIPCGALPVTIALEEGLMVMHSFWTPAPEELAALQAGQPVMLTIFGDSHPVVRMGVVKP